MDFRRTSLAELAEQVRSKQVAARELTRHALDRIDALNDSINAFVAVDEERAMRDAAAVDERVARGDDPGDLAGIPIGVKDLEDAAGFVTTKGMDARRDRPPAPADSVLVARLKAAGCIVVGKTNTPELGWKADTTNPAFGSTLNPWDLTRSSGGSSGGTGSALAAGMVPLATGSDGGGSIRIPAALCGLSGMKPSLGRVPSGGADPSNWPNLSTKGPMAMRTCDIALALDAVIGPDPQDLRSLPMPEPSWLAACEDPHVPMRVAWSPTLGYAEVDGEVAALCSRAVEVLVDLGAEVVEVERVFDEDPVLQWLTQTSIYNLRTIEQFRGTPAWDLLDAGMVAQAEWARNLAPTALATAEDENHRLNCRLVHLFHDVRLLVTPTVACEAPVSGQPGVVNGTATANWVRFTYPFNMTRSPAGTVCVGRTKAGLPVGLQLVGPQHGDLVVLRAMAALEAAIGFDELAPIG